jgi:transposase-like protein
MNGEVKTYTKELREQVLKEVKDTGNMAIVARQRGIAYATVVSWVGSERKAPSKKRRQEIRTLENRLKDVELENRILKELLKKTNQLWLTDGPSAPNS